MRYLPSIVKLRKSFRLRSREFLRENTLHGFNYFVDPSRPMWERVLWFVCTCMSLGAAIISIADILIKFTTAPMLTVVHIPKSSWYIEFPIVLACPSSEYLDLSNDTEDEAKTLIQLYDWNWKKVQIPKSFKVTPDLQHLFEASMPACKDIITNCKFMNKPMECAEMFITKSTQQGICCATRSTQLAVYNSSQSGVQFSPIFNKSINLYLQSEPVLFRGAPINYKLVNNISLVISMQVTTTPEGARLVDPVTRGCIMPDEGTSHSECQVTCQRKVFEELSCMPWWIKGDRTHTCRLTEYNQIIKGKTSFDKCYDKCPLQCNNTWYNMDEVKANDNITSIIMQKWPLVKYKRKVIFGVLELLVSLGGIMGLYLGYSVLTTVELIYYFTLRPYCGAVLSEEDRNAVNIRISAKPRKRKPLEGYIYRNFYM